MKVLMVDPWSYTPYYNYSLCQALVRAGCEVELVTSLFPYEPLPCGDGFRISHEFCRIFNRPRVRSSWLFETPFSRRLARVLEYPIDVALLLKRVIAENPEILHFQWAAMPIIDYALFRFLKAVDSKLVYTVHNVLPHRERRWHKSQYALLYKAADRIIAHSHSAKTELLENFSVNPSKVRVIPHGSLFQDAKLIPKEQAKRTLNIVPSQPVILFFGLIKPYKGLDYLIKAFSIIKRDIPDARLLIVGKPSEDFSVHEDLIEKLDISESVVVNLSFIRSAEVANYFCAADVVVLPYIKSYQSGVLLTAYTFGRPVVATAIGGLAEVVEQGKSGYVVPPRDENKLAEAISHILLDDAKKSQMGDYARHLAKTKYSWANIAKATLEVYKSSVERNRC